MRGGAISEELVEMEAVSPKNYGYTGVYAILVAFKWVISCCRVGELDESVASTISENDIVTTAVLSGNCNFEGCVHPFTRANYLAFPPLVVAYTLAGTIQTVMPRLLCKSRRNTTPIPLRDGSWRRRRGRWGDRRFGSRRCGFRTTNLIHLLCKSRLPLKTIFRGSNAEESPRTTSNSIPRSLLLLPRRHRRHHLRRLPHRQTHLQIRSPNQTLDLHLIRSPERHKLIMIVPIKPLLVLYILQSHIPKFHPRLQHFQNLLVHPTSVMYNNEVYNVPGCSVLLNFIFLLINFTISFKVVSSMTKTKRVLTLFLRFLAFGATIAVVIVMVTSHDSAEVLNLTFTAKYSNEQIFKYFLIAEAIACVYSLILLFICSQISLWRLVLILGMVIAMLLSSSVSAALAIAHLGKKGNSHAGWLPICGQVPKFCDHVTGALVAGFVTAIIHFLLFLFSLLHTQPSPLPVKLETDQSPFSL
ncbi:hypothetical protein RJT34_12750 [Clitoria ternatea]|uniref:CASP-like protein n=1 Tax=Clitoria ternatea TaxID=43366 RepID=A0AAN9JPE5_CLITE